MSGSRIIALKALIRAFIVFIILYIIVKLVALATGEVLIQEDILRYIMLGLLFLTISVFISFPETRTLLYGHSKLGDVRYYLSQITIYLIILALFLHYLSKVFAVALIDLKSVFLIVCAALAVVIFSDLVVQEKKVFGLEKLKVVPVKVLKAPRFKRIRFNNELELKLRTDSVILVIDGDYKGACIYGDSYLYIDSLFYSFGAFPRKRLRGFTLILSKGLKIPKGLEEVESSEAESYVQDFMEQNRILNKILERVKELIEEELRNKAIVATEEGDGIKIFKLWRLCALEDRSYRLKVINLGGLNMSEIKWLVALRDSRVILLKHSDGYMIVKCRTGFLKKLEKDCRKCCDV